MNKAFQVAKKQHPHLTKWSIILMMLVLREVAALTVNKIQLQERPKRIEWN